MGEIAELKYNDHIYNVYIIEFHKSILRMLQDPVDIQVKKALQDTLVRMVVRVYQDILVMMDHRVKLDNKVHLVLLG